MIDDSYTVSLLHMNGADGATTFTDETGKTWTANGSAQIDTAQSVFGGASGLFNGSSDSISAADHADWRLDGGSNSNLWTVDWCMRWNANPSGAQQPIMQQRVDNDNFLVIDKISANSLRLLVRSSGANIVSITNSWNPTNNVWYHVAVVKNGTSGYMMFVNGVQIGTTQTDTDPIPDFAGSMTIGKEIDTAGTSLYFNGWIDEFRISKGIARWTSGFTPHPIPYGFYGQVFVNNVLGTI